MLDSKTSPKFTIFLDGSQKPDNIFCPGKLFFNLFQAGDIADYEFIRVTSPLSLVPEIPLGRLPALRVDNVYLVGLTTICRALAARIALDGQSLVENSQIDMLGEMLSDCIDKIKSLCTCGTGISELADSTHSYTYSDESECEKMAVEFYLSAEVFSNVLPFLESFLAKNNNGRIVGNRETWADHMINHFLYILNELVKDTDKISLFEINEHTGLPMLDLSEWNSFQHIQSRLSNHK